MTDELAGAARAAHAAQKSALLSYALTRRGDLTGAGDAAKEASARAGDAVARLQRAGVPAETIHGGEPAPSLTLAELDTPDTRELLEGLRALLPVAERIDRERGRWYPDAPPTDTPGTDLAEQVHHLCCRLELEVHGPKGKD